MKFRLGCWISLHLAFLTSLAFAGNAPWLEIDPRALSARVALHGSAELNLDGNVRLSGVWNLPAGTVTIRTRGEVVAEGWRLQAPGTRVRIEAQSIRLGDATLDVSAARGGQVELRSRDAGGVIEINENASIDASGDGANGGRVLLAADRVFSRGSLLARGQGRIEVEARSGMRFDGPADTAGGLIRLDPSNMIIGAFAGTNTNVANGTSGTAVTRSPSADTGQLDAGNLATLLATNDVIVHTVAGGSATGITLPAGYATVLDATGGDIEVQAPVSWSSTHFLWLLAHDDLVVEASVQNSGAGAVLGLAGWDGSTFSGLTASDPTLASTAYGNNTGDAYILGGGASGGTAFGSQSGLTALHGRNLVIFGSTRSTGGNHFALVGYRVTTVLAPGAYDARGAIEVFAKGSITIQGGVPPTLNSNDIVRSAQIGHGGELDNAMPPSPPPGQGNLTGDITVVAGSTLLLQDGADFSYAQIGHGGLVVARTRGNIGPLTAGDPTSNITIQAASVQLSATSPGDLEGPYVQIGHGGTTWTGGVQGNLSGNITIGSAGTPVGSLSLVSNNPDPLGSAGGSVKGEVQIGHGGFLGSGNSIGQQNGTIDIHVAGDLTMTTPASTNHTGIAQIGHGGQIYFNGAMGNASGAINVAVGGKVDLLGGGPCDYSFNSVNFCTAQIGHGGALIAGSSATRGTIQGDVQVTAGLAMRLIGLGSVGASQIGHGGPILSFAGATATQGDVGPSGSGDGASGDVTVQAAAITIAGGSGQGSDAHIGHGGFFDACSATDCGGAGVPTAKSGRQAGNLSVTTTTGNLDMIGGSDAYGQAIAMIGNGGFDASSIGFGNQGAASGSITVLVKAETSLIDDSGSGATPWWIGHRSSGGINSPSAVLLDTGTLDFAAATATNATISDAQFWPRFAVNNVPAGSVTLRVHGLAPSANDGSLIVQQALTIPATTNAVVLRSTDDLTLSAAMTNNGSSFLDLVADDAAANQNPPNKSATALFTIDGSGSIAGTGDTRVFAVSPSQFTPGSYVPPAQASSIWYQTSGVPVVGVNFKALPLADLALTKVDTPDPVTPGANLTYTITVTNNGPDTASGLTLSDTLPAGTTFVSLAAPGGWTCSDPGVGNSGAIGCSATSLAAGSAAFTLTANVGPSVATGTILSNTATIASTTGDPSTGNESATATTTVDAASANLTVTKTDSPDPVTAGTNLTYTITVANAGPSSASTVQLSDALPAGTTFVSLASPGGWSCTTPAVGANGTITCSIAAFTPGNAAFTLVANVDASVVSGTVLSNTATVSSTTADPSSGNESDTETTTVGTASADLQITKVDTPDPVAPGANISYAVSITNNGPSSASNVQWSDALPAGTTFVSLASPGGWSCTTPAAGSSGTVTCSNTVMIPTTDAFTLVVHVAPSTAASTTIVNTVNVSSATSDPNGGNESATAQTTVSSAAADLSVTNVDTPDPVTPGTSLTYTITVANAGPSNASSVTLADTLPAGTTFVSLSSPGGWSCTTPAAGASGSINCSVAALAPGGAAFTLVVHVDSSVATSTVISNTATVSSTTADPNSGNESATATTTAGTATADLSASSSDAPDPVTPGTNLTYTITATNAGPGNATSAQLTDTLPAGTTFVSLSAPGGWSCTTPAIGGSGTVTCGLPTFSAGSAVFTLVVNVDPAVPPSSVVPNTATVSSATTDPNIGNENGVTSTTVGPGSADLSITNSDAPDPVTAGSNLTYTIAVTNAGPSDAANAHVIDALPAGTTFVSLTAQPGWTCTTPPAGANGTIDCSIASFGIGAASFTFVANVGGGVAGGTVLSDTATVSSAATDPSPRSESATSTTNVVASGSAAITGTKSVSGTFIPGGSITYVITLTNNSSAARTDNPGDELTDVLPSSLTLVSASASSGTAVANIGTNTVTWNGAFAANASVTITIHATINASVPVGTTISNQGSFMYDQNGDGTNEASGVTDDAAAAGNANATSFAVAAAATVPTLSALMLALFAALIGAVAFMKLRL